MSAALVRLTTRRHRLRAEQAAELRQQILNFDLPEDAVRSVLLAIDRETVAQRGWTFVMLSPAQNAAVVGWLRHNSSRAGMALQLWAELINGMRNDTGEVLLSRTELAERVGSRPSAVTEVLAELEKIGALSRQREPIQGVRGPGRLVVFINPNVATRLTGKARDKAQAEQPAVDTTDWTSRRKKPAASITQVS